MVDIVWSSRKSEQVTGNYVHCTLGANSDGGLAHTDDRISGVPRGASRLLGEAAWRARATCDSEPRLP